MSNSTIQDINQQLDIYLVGGAVRDQLLNREVTEHDYLVVGSTTEQMLSLGFVQVGKDFPVFLHPETKDEYALARTERKQGSGYTGFVCYAAPDVTIEQDLMRRDLTVNAMALSTANNGKLIDPYNGKKDLDARILRHVSPAFSEDPLRVLRVARFAARYHNYGFSIADETFTLMKELSASGELEHLSAERVWKEMSRSLAEDHPEVFFQVLKECGALKVIWPSLDKLWGVPNPKKWHPEICSGVHTMMVLQQAVKYSKKLSVRFAAVCHDLGKGITPEPNWPSHHGHEKLGLPLVKNICDTLKVPNQMQELALKCCEFHLHCHKAFELKPSTILAMFNKLDLWRKPEQFEDFLVVCQADYNGRLDFENKDYPQADFLQQTAKECLKINAKTYVEQGLQGKAIKQAMDDERLTKIAELQSNY